MQSAKELVLRCLSVCTEAEPAPAPAPYPAVAPGLAPYPALAPALAPATSDGLQAFFLGLNKRLADDDDAGRSGNLVTSPLSVYAALSLVAAGAREGTLDELLRVLGAPSRDFLAGHVRALAEHVLADGSRTGGPRVSFACGVWHDSTTLLRPAYRTAAAESYKAVARSANFRQEPEEAREQINAWVAAATNDLIPSILSPGALSSCTVLVLANAIYFKGKWEKPFDKELTEDGKFHRLDGTAVDAPLMRGLGRHSIACHDGFKVLQLRYVQGRSSPGQPQPPPIYSMCVFLPNARDGLWGLTDKIARDPGFLRKHLPCGDVLVGDFRLPKFKVSFGVTMKGILQDMGLKEAFELGKADLSDMVEDGAGKLALHKIVHRAVIEVNEEGTEAAAATVATMILCSYSVRPRVDFTADHPFAFFVIEEVSGATLFAGHVLDPTTN
ncbi:putative serpin-Z5 [Hordeum vulgare]|nr:putative serpin-Z5 [Hordeum vulgare]